MGINHVVLVAALAVFASVDAASEVKMSTNSVPSDRRLLRASKTYTFQDQDQDDSNSNDEERGWTGLTLLDDAVETAKLKLWHVQGKKVDEAFDTLKVDDVVDKIFTNPQWKTWVTYVHMVETTDADQTIVTKLMRVYGVDKVANMLGAAKKNANTKAIATTLESAQYQFWLKNTYSNTPEQIFKTLKVEQQADDLFDSPQLASWVNYLKLYNEKVPDKKTTELETFQKIYGEEKFMNLLFSAEYAKSAGAAGLKNQMVQSWLEFTTPPAKIFKQLKLDQAGDDLLKQPSLVYWVKYMKLFNKAIPRKETSMLKTFTDSYGEVGLAQILQKATAAEDTKKVATNLQSAQFKQWMSPPLERTPDDVFTKVLKLDPKNLQTSDADIWRAYYRAYDEEFPGKLFSFRP